jgi:dihydroorotate dehydrogenase (NAD+) catalytic subunit
MPDLSVTLGRLSLRNPVLVASGTFGYAKEMAGFVDFAKLGGVIPKTVTAAPRAGNAPPRTVETASGMLNAIGLDNDGLEHFLAHHLPYLRTLPTAVIGNIAGKTEDEFVAMAGRVAEAVKAAPLREAEGAGGNSSSGSFPPWEGGLGWGVEPSPERKPSPPPQPSPLKGEGAREIVGVASGDPADVRPPLAALELNLSCPNVSGGLDFATNPETTKRIVRRCREACPDLPLIAKLTPNVTALADIVKAAADGGADAVSCVNTFLGMAVDWRRRRPVLGNGVGGLSGPAIKPLALRCVWQAARVKAIPVIGVGGIATADDAMEFLVAGATAVQVGTTNFYDPTASVRIADELPGRLAELGAGSVREIVGTLQ